MQDLKTIWRVYFFTLFAAASLPATAALRTDVLTFHNDNARTGQNLNEEILTPANINTNTFGLLRVLPVGGKVDAQPLYVAGVQIPGKGLRNVLIVATEQASLFAYDADSAELFWQVSLLGMNERPSDNRGCNQVAPDIGITSTPVIDRGIGNNGAIFAVTMSEDSSLQHIQRLHSVDLATGADLVAPVIISAVYPGSGDGSVDGLVVFDPSMHKDRSALLLLDGVVYTAWGSHCDFRPYSGWIIGYDEQTLSQTSVLNLTPNGNGGAIWGSGGGLAADAAGNIFVLTANGSFDTDLTADGFPAMDNYGNVFLKISTANRMLSIADYFAPANTLEQNAIDGDLGSGGAILLPNMTDSTGASRQLVVGAGKDRNLYLADRLNLGKFNPDADAAYQVLSNTLPNGIFSTPAFFHDTLYYGPVGASLKAFPFQDARLSTSTSETETVFRYPGTTPSISANGVSNGIVWAVEGSTSSPAVLHAFSADDLTTELYNSDQAGTRDAFGDGNKYIVPTIASARVYVGTPSGVAVFGLLDQSTLTPVQTWRDNHFGNPSNAGAGADDATPAGDGTVNLVKYALGLDPLIATNLATLLVPSITLDTNAGQKFATLALTRFARPTDVSCFAEISSDLQNWTSSSDEILIVQDDANYLIARDAHPLGASPRFLRLRVSR